MNDRSAAPPTLGILASSNPAWEHYVGACEERGVPNYVVDLMGDAWVETLRSVECVGYLARPPSDFQERNAAYMERLRLLVQHFRRPIYPSYEELFLYENKRAVAGWLALEGFPCPETHVFLRKEEALRHVERCPLPIVVKSNLGAGSTGVRVLASRAAAKAVVEEAFGRDEARYARGAFLQKRDRRFRRRSWGRAQRHYLIVQPFVPIHCEWRIIRIGSSYFGHKRLLRDGYASGSGLKEWIAPPAELLDLARAICDRGGFLSMAVDIFETEQGEYLVNELQSVFGCQDDFQLKVDDHPGRYVFEDGSYRFEEGIFNRHESYGLRVDHFLEILRAESATRGGLAGA